MYEEQFQCPHVKTSTYRKNLFVSNFIQRLTKSSFKKYFLQCWKIGENKHQEEEQTVKICKQKPCRDVLNPEFFTKEFLEDQLSRFHDVAGLGEQLYDVLYEAFHSRRLPTPGPHVRGMLIYGPSGCGKTEFAKHFPKFLPAKQPLFIVSSMVMGVKNGEHIKKVRIFLKKAIADEKKYGARSQMYIVMIVGFLDRVAKKNKLERPDDDSEELLQELFTLMDGPDALNNIFVIATTNRIDLVDEGVLRQGKFELHVKIDYPTEKQRYQILDMLIWNLRDNYLLEGDVDISKLAVLTNGCASAYLRVLISRAHLIAFQRNKNSDVDLKMIMDDFLKAAEGERFTDEELMKIKELSSVVGYRRLVGGIDMNSCDSKYFLSWGI